jgi:D-alanine-D-alanine ligase-like ATP-grasp enzyme
MNQKNIKKEVCVYCGDAQTNHTLHFINTGMDLGIGFFLPRMELPQSPFFKLERSETVRLVGSWTAVVFEKVGIIRFSNDIDDAPSERTRTIWREAQKRGIHTQQIFVFGMKREESRAMLPPRKGSEKRAWEYFQSIPIPHWSSQPDTTWVDDKAIFKKKFEKNNLAIAKGRFVMTLAGAKKAFGELGAPVIVKPREGSRARHTTVDITSEEELTRAYARAKQLCPAVMIEQFVSGTLYRATCVGGKLIGVIEFVKPAVIADGVKTVAELRLHHNAHKKFPNLTDVKDDAWFRDAISHQGYDLESVPSAGTKVLLSEHSERPNGGYFVDITDEIPEKTREEIERAACVCEIEVIGFDIISKDLKNAELPFTFIEGNSLPYIEVHHIPYEGSPRNVAGAIWDLWFEK